MPASVVAQQADHLSRDGLGVAERVGQGTRRDLRFVEIWRYVKVRGADELLQSFKVHKLVVEDDVLLDLILLGKDFEAEPVSSTVLAQFVGMSGAQDNVNNVGKLLQNMRQSVKHIFDPFVRRE